MSPRHPGTRRAGARWRNCSRPSVHLTPQWSMVVLAPTVLRSLGRGAGDPVEVRRTGSRPREMVSWFPDHEASPNPAAKALLEEPVGTAATIGPCVGTEATRPPGPGDHTTGRLPAPQSAAGRLGLLACYGGGLPYPDSPPRDTNPT